MQCHVAHFSGLRGHAGFIDNEPSHQTKDSGDLIGWQWYKPFDNVTMDGLIDIAPSPALTHHVEIVSELASFRESHHLLGTPPCAVNCITKLDTVTPSPFAWLPLQTLLKYPDAAVR